MYDDPHLSKYNPKKKYPLTDFDVCGAIWSFVSFLVSVSEH